MAGISQMQKAQLVDEVMARAHSGATTSRSASLKLKSKLGQHYFAV